MSIPITLIAVALLSGALGFFLNLPTVVCAVCVAVGCLFIVVTFVLEEKFDYFEEALGFLLIFSFFPIFIGIFLFLGNLLKSLLPS